MDLHIRPDNKGWSDGTPVTAGDFVYSWRRQLDPATRPPTPVSSSTSSTPSSSTPVGYRRCQRSIERQSADRRRSRSQGYRRLDARGHDGRAARRTSRKWWRYTAAVPAPEVAGREATATSGPSEANVPRLCPTVRSRWTTGTRASDDLSKNEGYWDAENIKLTNVIDPIYPAANAVLLYENGSGDQQLDWTSWTPPTISASPRIPSWPSRYRHTSIQASGCCCRR